MKLPPFTLRLFEVKRGSAYLIPLPKPSTSFLKEIYELMKNMGLSYSHGKFKRRRKSVLISYRGSLLSNFEPVELLRELSKVRWNEFIEFHGLTPTWNNGYFTRLQDGIKLHLRMNLSRREFWRLVGLGKGLILPDEAYIVLNLALRSRSFEMISCKTYSADSVEYVRRVGSLSFYRVKFSNLSVRNCINEIWKDVLTGHPVLLPEPGTNVFKMKMGEVDLIGMFAGLNEWCLSDEHLALPLRDYPSIHTSRDVL